jgi:type 1 fimbria pilin
MVGAGIPYCKPHYYATFKQKGNFDDFAIERVTSSSSNVNVQMETGDDRLANPNTVGTTTPTTRKWIKTTTPRELKPVNKTSPAPSNVRIGLVFHPPSDQIPQPQQQQQHPDRINSNGCDKTVTITRIIGFKEAKARFESSIQ